MNNPHSYSCILGAGPAAPPRDSSNVAPLMLLFLLLIGALALLAATATLLRWSIRRAARTEKAAGRKALPESAWKVAGKRATPVDDQPDQGSDE